MSKILDNVNTPEDLKKLNINEKQKLEYLTIVKNMFSLINQYNLMIKDSLASKQMLINDVFLEVYKKGIEKSICEFINLIDS